MMTDTDLYILAEINSGLRCDLQRLQEISGEIERLLNQAKTFPGLSAQAASTDWGSLDRDLDTIRHHAEQIEKSVEGDSGDPRKNWKIIVEHDRRIEETFLRLRDSLGAELSEEAQRRWKDLWRLIFVQLEAIRARAAVAQTRTEMRMRYGQKETDEVAREILSKMPDDASLSEATRYAEEYRKAHEEYQKDRGRVGGFLDIVKALMLIQPETPDAIARRRMAGVTRLAT